MTLYQEKTTVGVDVGGTRKGFHAVALRGADFVDKTSGGLSKIVDWIVALNPSVVAIDAPCKWSREESGRTSRRAERDLQLFDKKISCFSTPSRSHAGERKFYEWVVSGQALYAALANNYPLFDGEHLQDGICIETFPHAVTCALAGEIASAKQKASRRRQVLMDNSYNPALLTNIDFVDAGLCSVAASAFLSGDFKAFGDDDEGFIVVPKAGSQFLG